MSDDLLISVTLGCFSVGYAGNPLRKTKKVREEKKRLYVKPEEVRLIVEDLDTRSKKARKKNQRALHLKFRMFVEALLNTGMRGSELLGLKINQVDFERNVIFLERTS